MRPRRWTIWTQRTQQSVLKRYYGWSHVEYQSLLKDLVLESEYLGSAAS